MKNNVIVKRNDFLRLGYSLTIMEQRLLLACISQVDSRSKLEKEDAFEVTVQEIQDIFGNERSKQFYRDLELAADRILTRLITHKKSDTVIRKFHWVHTVDYIKDESKIILHFHPDIIPYISEITERFTRYKLNDVKDFKCIYSLRLYELFAQFQGIESREITIDELRLLLDLDKKYLLYAEFKRCVIEKSINEINAHSNLTVKFNEQRKGRKVNAIQFFFVTKIKTLPTKIDQPTATMQKTSLEEREILVEEFANSRKRFGNAVNENIIPADIVEILKSQGRW